MEFNTPLHIYRNCVNSRSPPSNGESVIIYQDYSRKNKEFMEEIVWIPETEENIVWIPDYSLQILPPSRLRRSTNNNYINGFI